MKNKLFLIINIIFILICIGIDIALGIINKFNISFFYSTLFFIMGIGIGNLLIMIIHMLTDNKYNYKGLIPIFHISYLIIAAIMYYAIEVLKHYAEYYLIYWLILGSTIIIDLVVFIIIIKLKKENKKPQFMVKQ